MWYTNRFIEYCLYDLVYWDLDCDRYNNRSKFCYLELTWDTRRYWLRCFVGGHLKLFSSIWSTDIGLQILSLPFCSILYKGVRDCESIYTINISYIITALLRQLFSGNDICSVTSLTAIGLCLCSTGSNDRTFSNHRNSI